MSAPSLPVKLGIAAVVIPAIGFALGLLLQVIIPGCQCDEGSGCHGCGSLDEPIAFLVFGGFIGTIGALIFVLPVTLLLAALFRRFPTLPQADAYGSLETKPLLIGIAKRALLLALVVLVVFAVAVAFLPRP